MVTILPSAAGTVIGQMVNILLSAVVSREPQADNTIGQQAATTRASDLHHTLEIPRGQIGADLWV